VFATFFFGGCWSIVFSENCPNPKNFAVHPFRVLTWPASRSISPSSSLSSRRQSELAPSLGCFLDSFCLD
jgi:hypothetical protein